MNKRIAELRIQAWKKVDELKLEEQERETEFAKEFALLIINECLSIAKKTQAPYCSDLGGITIFDSIERTIQKKLIDEKVDWMDYWVRGN